MFDPVKLVESLFSTVDHRLATLFGAPASKQFVAASDLILKSELGTLALDALKDVPTSALESESAWEAAGAKIAAQALLLGVVLAKSELALLISTAVASIKRTSPVGAS